MTVFVSTLEKTIKSFTGRSFLVILSKMNSREENYEQIIDFLERGHEVEKVSFLNEVFRAAFFYETYLVNPEKVEILVQLLQYSLNKILALGMRRIYYCNNPDDTSRFSITYDSRQIQNSNQYKELESEISDINDSNNDMSEEFSRINLKESQELNFKIQNVSALGGQNLQSYEKIVYYLKKVFKRIKKLPRDKKRAQFKKRFKKSLKALQFVLDNKDFSALEVLKKNLKNFVGELKAEKPQENAMNAKSFVTHLAWLMGKK